MTDEVIGWLTGPRSSIYHRDQEHADALVGDGGLYPVTASEADKFGLTPCHRCSTPKHKPVPENVIATGKALRRMFVVEGTEAELNQMAEDFLTDLAEFGFTVRRIPRRAKNTTDVVVTDYLVDVTVVPKPGTATGHDVLAEALAPHVPQTLNAPVVLDAEPDAHPPTVQQEDTPS